ncbi:hypothetical protein IWX90DRAFT_95274 [Phyllosticta citrichinensis]|uniref:Uncharacterized protein n=1 Tax=Phyllosticta citrichinensis TaxID=1130410 RepID=A0ABR1XEW1_9PEZI
MLEPVRSSRNRARNARPSIRHSDDSNSHFLCFAPPCCSSVRRGCRLLVDGLVHVFFFFFFFFVGAYVYIRVSPSRALYLSTATVYLSLYLPCLSLTYATRNVCTDQYTWCMRACGRAGLRTDGRSVVMCWCCFRGTYPKPTTTVGVSFLSAPTICLRQ